MSRLAGLALLALALGCARKPATGAPARVRDYRCHTAHAGTPLHADCEFVDAGNEVRLGCAISGRPLFALIGWNRRAELFVNADDDHPAAHYRLRHGGRFSPAVLKQLLDPAPEGITAGAGVYPVSARRERDAEAIVISLPEGPDIVCTPGHAAESIPLPPPPPWLKSLPARDPAELRERLKTLAVNP